MGYGWLLQGVFDDRDKPQEGGNCLARNKRGVRVAVEMML